MSKFIKLTSTNNYDEKYKLLVNVDNILYVYVENNETCIVFNKDSKKVVIESLNDIENKIQDTEE